MAGKYRLDRVLGRGATATVFAATHLRNANQVAVKVLHAHLRDNVDIRVRFLREGYAANSVGHPGTVRVLDDGTDEDGRVFCVMELLQGESLDALWEQRGRKLSAGEVGEMMGQLLDILAAAHARGVVHRDIKPENLFIERDGTLRVMDFGVARFLAGAFHETRSGSIIGTLPYMAPEQVLGRVHDVDARSDLWSVGATAFTLVSGRFVHAAATPEEMMVFTASRQAISLASVAPEVPAAFARVVDRALRFDRDDRWSSAQSMRDAFSDALLTRQGDTGEEAPDVESADRISSPESNVSEDGPTVRVVVPPPLPAVPAMPAVAWPAADFRSRRPALSLSSTLVSAGTPAARRVRQGRRWVLGAAAAAAASIMSLAALRPGGPSGLAFARERLPASAAGVTDQQGSSFGPGAAPAMVPATEDKSATASTQGPLVAQASVDALGVPVTPPMAALWRAGGAVLPPSAPVPLARSGTALVPAAGARAKDEAALTSTPPSPTALTRPDNCSPPFTIVASTGKKLWKRACL